jgi:hypothetical protein
MWPFAPRASAAHIAHSGPAVPTSGNNSSGVMMPPANQLERAVAMIRRIGHEIHFIAVLRPRSPHRRRQLPVGQHSRPGLFHPRVDDGRGCRFALGAAMRSGDGERKSGPGSWGLYQLISHSAFAAMALARRWSPLSHPADQNPTLDLKAPRTELRSVDWFVSYACHPPAWSEWPFPLDEGGEPTTSSSELGLREDSISRVPTPVI